MKWYLQNLRCGLRTALFLSSSERFVATWHALMAITGTAIVSQLLLELIIDGAGGRLAYTWYGYLSCLFSFTLVVSYIIGHLTRQGGRVLEIAVSFLNSYYFVFLLYAFMHIVAPAKFYSSGIGPFASQLTPIWAFLVMYRITGVTCAADLRYLVIAGLLAAGAIYVLDARVYFSRIYYAVSPSDDEDEDASPLDKLTSEEIFSLQDSLRQKGLHQLKASKPGQTDIYALTLGFYAYQDVFLRDVSYVDARLGTRLGVTNIVPMINNKTTVETTPLADSTNLKEYLQALSARFMQPKEDILFLYLTSHGGPKDGLAVNLSYDATLKGLSPQLLKKTLDDSGIQNRVIIISACYSGVFIPVLQDEHTMVITAASKDRVSFGCSDKSNLTYFTQAYFMDGLTQTTDLEKAFAIAKDAVLKRETAEGITEHSNPQIFVGSKIKEVLRRYKGANLASAAGQ